MRKNIPESIKLLILFVLVPLVVGGLLVHALDRSEARMGYSIDNG